PEAHDRSRRRARDLFAGTARRAAEVRCRHVGRRGEEGRPFAQLRTTMPDIKIDAHVHVFTTDMPLIDNPRHAPTYSFTHEDLIATMDSNGVERAVIAAASPWGDYNDYTLAAVRAHPKRLRGTAILKPTVDRFALEAMSRDGMVGVRLPFIGLPKLPDITTFDHRALFRGLADLDWHVHPHVEGEDLPKILPTLEASGVKIVVDHLGRPDSRTG